MGGSVLHACPLLIPFSAHCLCLAAERAFRTLNSACVGSAACTRYLWWTRPECRPDYSPPLRGRYIERILWEARSSARRPCPSSARSTATAGKRFSRLSTSACGVVDRSFRSDRSPWAISAFIAPCDSHRNDGTPSCAFPCLFEHRNGSSGTTAIGSHRQPTPRPSRRQPPAAPLAPGVAAPCPLAAPKRTCRNQSADLPLRHCHPNSRKRVFRWTPDGLFAGIRPRRRQPEHDRMLWKRNQGTTGGWSDSAGILGNRPPQSFICPGIAARTRPRVDQTRSVAALHLEPRAAAGLRPARRMRGPQKCEATGRLSARWRERPPVRSSQRAFPAT